MGSMIAFHACFVKHFVQLIPHDHSPAKPLIPLVFPWQRGVSALRGMREKKRPRQDLNLQPKGTNRLLFPVELRGRGGTKRQSLTRGISSMAHSSFRELLEHIV